VKAIGKGLSIPLDSFAFGLDPAALLRADRRDRKDWLFHIHHPSPRHVMALAIARWDGSRIRVTQEEATLDRLCESVLRSGRRTVAAQ
jgi:hypothetical protein